MKADEGYIEVPGGRVWYRPVGEQSDATPLLCLHGEDASHLCFAEQPAQFNDIINEFMDRTSTGSST
jgi:hypothetical protein